MLLFAIIGCAVEPASLDPGETGVSPTRFALPLDQPELFYQVVGVDHDPEVQDDGIASGICEDYEGRAFPWCYDGHDGTDFLLEGAFDTMDAGSVSVLAGADGVVIETDDGHYDRCHATPTGVSCDGHEMQANYVIVEHADGFRSLYWHLMTDSVAVRVGQEVACGEPLGLVGSSGVSSMPHLHFEVHDPDDAAVDPYAGPASQETSWWVEQGSPNGLPGTGCSG